MTYIKHTFPIYCSLHFILLVSITLVYNFFPKLLFNVLPAEHKITDHTHVYVRVLENNRAWGSVVVKALRYQSGGLGIDSRWCHWGFFSVAPDGTMCPRVDSAPENEYQGFLLG